jgi:hypothetical protein
MNKQQKLKLLHTRIYLLDINAVEDTKHLNPEGSGFKPKKYMKVSEQQGLVLSPQGFQRQMNADQINMSNYYIYIAYDDSFTP